MNYLFIDGSYYCFYRYYAIRSWYNRYKKIEDNENLFDNNHFKEKYDKLFLEKVDEFIKKMNIKDFKLIIGKDCRRSDIWRNEFYDNYKGTRVHNDNNISKFIIHSYENLYPKILKKYNGTMLYIDKLEADDCISLYVNYLKRNNYDKIYIITNDNDYLQLIDKNIFIYNLRYKLINVKLYDKTPEEYLYDKICLGDKSDNITPIYPSRRTLNKMSREEIEKNETYLKNRKLIDFNYIPNNFVEEFNKKYLNFS